MTSSPAPPLRLVILMPVFDDFEAANLVCRALDEVLTPLGDVAARVLLLDDGSPRGCTGWAPFAPRSLTRIELLELRRNLGHQRALAVGLCHLDAEAACDAVLVMDADGEDRPEDVPRLIAELRSRPGTMIFAERRKRLEGTVFRLGYWAYRRLHRLLTGVSVRVGNFSILPAAALHRLVSMSELWNHYAGAAMRSRLPHAALPTDRGSRVLGSSKMGGLIPLVMHGISGIATFHDVVATRLLVVSVSLLAGLALALLAVLGVRFGTALAIPGWATYTAGLLLVLGIQVFTMAFGLVFTLVSERPRATVVPCRDYTLFVGQLRTLAERA
jgi:polyisoprenyl-phosphate glycosyltransferase